MKKSVIITLAVLAASVAAQSAHGEAKIGEALFKEKCASCHPDGGNIINPKQTLKGLKSRKLITDKIRKGGGGMSAFDKKAVSDADAKVIADYVLKTFKK